MAEQEKSDPIQDTETEASGPLEGEVEPPVETAGEEADPQRLANLLEDARSRADDHWNQCLRLQAELDNLRKRAERDVTNAHKFALEKFVQELLPVRDSLEMGIAAARDGETVDADKLLEGKELTGKMLWSALEKFGVRELDPMGEKFNPEYHEAMSIQERADVEPNTVVTVVQKGYVLNDRLVRPAMVIVSKAPAQAQGGQLDERA